MPIALNQGSLKKKKKIGKNVKQVRGVSIQFGSIVRIGSVLLLDTYGCTGEN